jgi:hypothetical protein
MNLCTGLIHLNTGPASGCFEHGNDLLGSTECEEFVECSGGYWLRGIVLVVG